MRNGRACLVLLGVLSVLPNPAQPQELLWTSTSRLSVFSDPRFAGVQEPVVVPGSRVRLKVMDPAKDAFHPHSYEGLLLGWDDEAIRFERRESEDEVSILFSTVTRFETVQGKKGSAGFGAVIGLVGGFIIAKIATGGKHYTPGGEGVADVTALGLMGIGAGVGALVGKAIKRDRWVAVPLERLRSGGVRR